MNYDQPGYAQFEGEIVPEKKVNSYEVVPGKEVKFLSFIPELGFPGCFLRFIRLHIGKKFKVLGTNKKGHEVYGYQQSSRRHHIFSMAVHYANLVLGYFFLRKYFGDNVAFGTCLLYAVHPLTTQTVAWISGINYNFSMLGALAVLNTAVYVSDYHWAVPLVVAFSFFSGITLYIGCFTFLILLFLGFKWFALASGIIGILILFWKGSETKNFRTKAFKEQNMDATTFLSWRKPIVMFKTLWYYVPQVLLPIKMGLYHVWGYFYEEPIERIDKMFWLGILTAGLSLFGFVNGDLAIQLGIVWFLSYFFIFSNFITAQQFVADRYVSVPAFGICLILAKLLYPTPLFWIILGLYGMRTFLHLPTFKNEVDFYLSNFLNFRKSEVALGNLGASYVNQGMAGSAVDAWMLSTKVNPFYDVAWYNLYSIFKANGRLAEAKTFLENTLKAKVVHFEKRWKEELEQLNTQMNPPVTEVDRLYNDAKSLFEQGKFSEEEEILKKILTMPTNNILPQAMEGLKMRLGEIEAWKKKSSSPA